MSPGTLSGTATLGYRVLVSRGPSPNLGEALAAACWRGKENGLEGKRLDQTLRGSGWRASSTLVHDAPITKPQFPIWKKTVGTSSLLMRNFEYLARPSVKMLWRT